MKSNLNKFEHVQNVGPPVDKMTHGQTLLKTLPSLPLAGCKYTWPCCCGLVVSVYIAQGCVAGMFGVVFVDSIVLHSSTNKQAVRVR